MRTTLRIEKRDRGYNAFMRRMKKLQNKPHVIVGVFGAKGTAVHPSTEEVKRPLTTAEIGAIHEFGMGNVPERSFIRGTLDARKRRVAQQMNVEFRRVIDGEQTTRMALERLGLFAKGLIQERMAEGIPPPLKRTKANRVRVARKDGEQDRRFKRARTPLIDTGTLRASIDYEVRGA